MATARYEPDHAQIAAWLRSSPELRAGCKAAAEDIAAKAKARSPRGKPRKDHRHFADSIHVTAGMSDKGDRVAARVVADSDDALAVEFGTARQSGHHVLGAFTKGA